MADISFSCDVNQAFNFEMDKQVVVGHLDTLTIGTTALEIDLTVTDPLAPEGDSKTVCGVLSGIFWTGGYSDPIQINAQVSIKNKSTIATMMHMKQMQNVDITFSYTVYTYDPVAKLYFQCFRGGVDAELSGLIDKSGGQLNISISDYEASDVTSPKLFDFSISVLPEESVAEQAIHFAVGSTDNIVKPWGINVTSSAA
ncbi:Uncharacterized protein dnl_35310 [Desulfonema limicola]|uniref:Uncharacterized protein n=1 Tax=Desulfonema limicola TaxID=45656 RepID=A0A975B9T3_9BACT|nr:hypothetical protein [Desulfonema limicola]QTA81200.1 Uncharacterized protein dnl_35310 [Desulfonema limicola]